MCLSLTNPYTSSINIVLSFKNGQLVIPSQMTSYSFVESYYRYTYIGSDKYQYLFPWPYKHRCYRIWCTILCLFICIHQNPLDALKNCDKYI